MRSRITECNKQRVSIWLPLHQKSTSEMNKVFFTFTLCFMALCSCSDEKIKDELYSINYGTKAERVAALKKEIPAYSDFENAEFQLYNSKGFTFNIHTFHMPEYRDYKYVVKVNPEDIDKWLTGLKKVGPSESFEEWPDQLIRIRKEEWQLQSAPEYYALENEIVYVLIYRKEGVIFKKSIAL